MKSGSVGTNMKVMFLECMQNEIGRYMALECGEC